MILWFVHYKDYSEESVLNYASSMTRVLSENSHELLALHAFTKRKHAVEHRDHLNRNAGMNIFKVVRKAVI